MATAAQSARLRRKVGFSITDTTSLPQAEIDELISQAEEVREDADGIVTAAAIYYLEGVLASSAKLATYRQNQTTENVSDIFGHVKELLTYHKEDLLAADLALAGVSGTVRSGRPQHLPYRWKQYPYS